MTKVRTLGVRLQRALTEPVLRSFQFRRFGVRVPEVPREVESGLRIDAADVFPAGVFHVPPSRTASAAAAAVGRRRGRGGDVVGDLEGEGIDRAFLGWSELDQEGLACGSGIDGFSKSISLRTRPRAEGRGSSAQSFEKSRERFAQPTSDVVGRSGQHQHGRDSSRDGPFVREVVRVDGVDRAQLGLDRSRARVGVVRSREARLCVDAEVRVL